jgi:hypothetical protein
VIDGETCALLGMVASAGLAQRCAFLTVLSAVGTMNRAMLVGRITNRHARRSVLLCAA